MSKSATERKAFRWCQIRGLGVMRAGCCRRAWRCTGGRGEAERREDGPDDGINHICGGRRQTVAAKWQLVEQPQCLCPSSSRAGDDEGGGSPWMGERLAGAPALLAAATPGSGPGKEYATSIRRGAPVAWPGSYVLHACTCLHTRSLLMATLAIVPCRT